MDEQQSLIPWYFNQTLSDVESQSVADWISQDPRRAEVETFTRQIAAAVSSQVCHAPSRKVEWQIFSRLPNKKPVTGVLQWAWGVPLAFVFFALLWLFVQPGTQLQWTVNPANLAAFRIYRSAAGSNDFDLIEEIPADRSQANYQFADAHIIPGKTYYYIIEGVAENGRSFRTSAVTIHSLANLASQFAILLTSFILTFGIITITRELNRSPLLQFGMDS